MCLHTHNTYDDVVFPDQIVSVGAGMALPCSGSVFPWARVPDVFETQLEIGGKFKKKSVLG